MPQSFTGCGISAYVFINMIAKEDKGVKESKQAKPENKEKIQQLNQRMEKEDFKELVKKEGDYENKINEILEARPDVKKLKEMFSAASKSLGIQENTMQNYTRFPIAVLEYCGWIEKEKIMAFEAVSAYTYGSACACKSENIIGTLEIGKYADICVLDRNILKIVPEEIIDTKCLLTMVGGKIVYHVKD